MTKGDQVTITGARQFSGRVLSVDAQMMIVGLEGKRSVTIRRFPESTTPEQWRIGGLPVTVRPAVDHTDLNARLARLLELARADE
jgi:hypothetical protein